MLKALKVTMYVWGVVGILFGLAFILIPEQLGEMMGYQPGPDYVHYMLASLGGVFIAGSVFIIIAARDPLKYINWVKFAILSSLLGLVLGLYSIVMGYVNFTQAGTGVIIDAVFAAALFAFYPYKAAKEGQ